MLYYIEKLFQKSTQKNWLKIDFSKGFVAEEDILWDVTLND